MTLAGSGSGMRGQSASTFGTSAPSADGTGGVAREMEQAKKAAGVLGGAVRATNERIDKLRAENCTLHARWIPGQDAADVLVWTWCAAELVMQLAGC